MTDSLRLGKNVNIVSHLCLHFLHRDTADGGKVGKHTDVLQIVQFAENAQLRKLGDAREEHEPQIGVTVLQRTVEVAHHLTENGQLLVLMHHI